MMRGPVDVTAFAVPLTVAPVRTAPDQAGTLTDAELTEHSSDSSADRPGATEAGESHDHLLHSPA